MNGAAPPAAASSSAASAGTALVDDPARLGSARGLRRARGLGLADDPRRLAARDAELPVDRDRLGLDRVARDVEALADLAEREVGREEGQQSELGRGQAGGLLAVRHGYRRELLLQFPCDCREHADVGTAADDL